MNFNQIQVDGPNDCPSVTTTYNSSEEPIPKLYGWICPKCGRTYSPSTDMCLYCSGDNNVMTETTTKKEWWRDYCTITSDLNKLPKQELPTIDADTFCVHYDQLPFYTTITTWS